MSELTPVNNISHVRGLTTEKLAPIRALFYSLLSIWFLIFSCGSIYLIFTGYPGEYYLDYVTYIAGAGLVREGLGGMLYDLPENINIQSSLLDIYVGDGVLPYRALPVVALLYQPFSYLPLSLSYSLFVILVVAVYAVLAVCMREEIRSRCLPFLLVFGYPAVFLSILNGQFTVMAIFLLLVSRLLLERKKDIWLGFAVGWLVLKPHIFLVPFLCFLILSKNKIRYLSGTFISTVAALSASLLIAGPAFIDNYISFVLKTESPSFGSPLSANYSLQPMLRLLMSGNVGIEIILGINLLLLFVFLYWFSVLRKSLNNSRLFFIIVFGTILFGFHTHLYDLALFIAPVFIFISERLRNRNLTEIESLYLLAIYFGTFFCLLPGVPFVVKPLYLIVLCCIIASETVLPT